MKKYILPLLAWLVLSLEPGIVQYHLFAQAGIFATLLVLFQSAILWGLILTFSRRIVAVLMSIEAIVLTGLLSWHQHFADAMTLQVIRNQFQEGLHFILVAGQGLLSPLVIAALLIWLLQLIYILKWWRPLPWKFNLRLILGIPTLIILLTAGKSFYKEPFSFTDFNLIARNFGYGTAWFYEGMTNLQSNILFDEIVENANTPTPPLPAELQGMKLPKHIFIIQVESLDYAGYMTPGVMPFLQELSNQSLVYAIRPKPRHQSANADFMTISKANNFRQYYFAIYTLLPPEYYDKLPLLTKKAQQLGYTSSFYHGFSKRYYNRGEGIKSAGFQNIWFWDNLPVTEKNGAWGVDDLDLMKFALAQDAATGDVKQLHFMVTVSSHENFDIGLKNRQPFANPRTRLECYYNSLNYVDGAFRELMSKAPKDSLFILYSDHQSGEEADTRTLFYIYNKADPRTFEGEINYEQLPLVIHGLFDEARPS